YLDSISRRELVKRLLVWSAAAVSILALRPTAAKADVISSGGFSVGVGPNGTLYDVNSNVGFMRTGDGYDPLAPGNPRDSWGIAANGNSAFADPFFQGTTVLSTTSSFLPNSAHLVTDTGLGLLVTQDFSFVAGNVVMVTTTIQNTGDTTATNLLFQRD